MSSEVATSLCRCSRSWLGLLLLGSDLRVRRAETTGLDDLQQTVIKHLPRYARTGATCLVQLDCLVEQDSITHATNQP